MGSAFAKFRDESLVRLGDWGRDTGAPGKPVKQQGGSFVQVVLESPRPGGLGSNSSSLTLPSESICWAL